MNLGQTIPISVEADVMQTWRELISQDFVETNDEDEFD